MYDPLYNLTENSRNSASISLARKIFIVLNSTLMGPLFGGLFIVGFLGYTDYVLR